MNAEVEEPLTEPANRDGVLAVFEEESAMADALRELETDSQAASECRVIRSTDDLGPMLLTPTEPQPPRNRRIRYGVVLGILIGGGVGLALNAAVEIWPWMPVLAAFLGAVVGVLWGSTLAGLSFQNYRDDTIAKLKRYHEQDRSLLLVLGEKSALRRSQEILRRFHPVEILTSVSED